jgi:hypothetical protein
VADKFTPLILDAITLAATEPRGLPLFQGKADAGLFPSATAGKSAARKALDEGYLQVVRTETIGKATRELTAATAKGLQWLVESQSPKKVLEDFVRVLEARETQVTELVQTAHRLAESLTGLKTTIAQILPQILSERVSTSDDHYPGLRNGTPMKTLSRNSEAVALLEPVTDLEDLGGAILARLSDWSSSAIAGQDCPLPELFRSLSLRATPPSLGIFHDCIRKLHDEHRIYLHPWTGPLYALPEPSTALLVGHNIAYYASLRSA